MALPVLPKNHMACVDIDASRSIRQQVSGFQWALQQLGERMGCNGRESLNGSFGLCAQVSHVYSLVTASLLSRLPPASSV